MSDQVTVRPNVSSRAPRRSQTLRVGIVGWRGMVGSVLMQRMLEEHDFALIEPAFFTTSNVGGEPPAIGKRVGALDHPEHGVHDLFFAQQQEIMQVVAHDGTAAIIRFFRLRCRRRAARFRARPG